MRTSNIVPLGTVTVLGTTADAGGGAAEGVVGAGAAAEGPLPVKVSAKALLISMTCMPEPVVKRIVAAVPPE